MATDYRTKRSILIEGGKYDNSDWYLNREIERVKKVEKDG